MLQRLKTKKSLICCFPNRPKAFNLEETTDFDAHVQKQAVQFSLLSPPFTFN